MTAGAGPDFSVVVPTYRRPVELARCLAALVRLDPRGPSYEVLVVDDGGGDVQAGPTTGVPASGDRQIQIVHRSHAGPAAARNAGASLARGRWLAFTDDDCEPRPDWLTGFAAAYAERPTACLGGATRNGRADDALASAHQILIDFVCRPRRPERSPPFFPSNNLAVPRAEFLAAGGFDERFPFAAGEDREFCARWSAAGGELAMAPVAWVDHRHAFDLGGFVGMHFRYGRGAYRFHRRRARDEGRRVRLEPWGYYVRLVVAPLVAPRAPNAVRLAAALLLSQFVHACGFFRERLASLVSRGAVDVAAPRSQVAGGGGGGVEPPAASSA